MKQQPDTFCPICKSTLVHKGMDCPNPRCPNHDAPKRKRTGEPKMRIFIEDSFDAAHFLPNVPDGHKCRSLHGHTYRIRLEFGGVLNSTSGWIIDYADVKQYWNFIKKDLDHKCLNDVPGLENPTCEIIAQYIYGRLDYPSELTSLKRIEIRETEHCGVVLEQ